LKELEREAFSRNWQFGRHVHDDPFSRNLNAPPRPFIRTRSGRISSPRTISFRAVIPLNEGPLRVSESPVFAAGNLGRNDPKRLPHGKRFFRFGRNDGGRKVRGGEQKVHSREEVLLASG